MEVKLLGGHPDLDSSNLVVARSTCTGGTCFFMESLTPDEKLMHLLLTRLERISVDSYWAHRASGVRGALIRVMEESEAQENTDTQMLERLSKLGLQILERAARETR